jgi:hypothetical protein
MKAGRVKRIRAIEQEQDQQRHRQSRPRIDLCRLSDVELERLEWFGERRASWDGTELAWVHGDLSSDERLELDALLTKVQVRRLL